MTGPKTDNEIREIMRECPLHCRQTIDQLLDDRRELGEALLSLCAMHECGEPPGARPRWLHKALGIYLSVTTRPDRTNREDMPS